MKAFSDSTPQRSSRGSASDETGRFYDRLADFYHLIYPDWNSAIARQAAALDSIIREFAPGAKSILDLACGIGTQSLGLARLGYTVTASDLSQASVERARREAALRELSIVFSTGSLLQAREIHQEQADVVIACDNAIPHLLSDEEILLSLRQMLDRTKPGGLSLISVRDYETIDLSQETLVPYGVRYENGKRFVLLQAWRPELPFYDVDFYLIEDSGGSEISSFVTRSRYYAIPIPRLLHLMSEAGFSDVHCLKDRFFQPILLGIRK